MLERKMTCPRGAQCLDILLFVISFPSATGGLPAWERITDSSTVREQRERGLANLSGQTEAEPELDPGIWVRLN